MEQHYIEGSLCDCRVVNYYHYKSIPNFLPQHFTDGNFLVSLTPNQGHNQHHLFHWNCHLCRFLSKLEKFSFKGRRFEWTKFESGSSIQESMLYLNKLKSSLTTLRRNNALWLVETMHVTFNIQSGCFISG